MSELDELRAENKRLAAAYQRVVDESASRELEKTTSAADWQERMDSVRNRELEGLKAELAAAKRREEQVRADVVALREFVRKERVRALEASEDSDDTFDETELAGQFAAYCAVLMRLDELETFREVK